MVIQFLTFNNNYPKTASIFDQTNGLKDSFEIVNKIKENLESINEGRQSNLLFGFELNGFTSGNITTFISDEKVLTSTALKGIIGFREVKKKYKNISETANSIYFSVKKQNDFKKQIKNEINFIEKHFPLEDFKSMVKGFNNEKTLVYINKEIERIIKPKSTIKTIEGKLEKINQIILNLEEIINAFNLTINDNLMDDIKKYNDLYSESKIDITNVSILKKWYEEKAEINKKILILEYEKHTEGSNITTKVKIFKKSLLTTVLFIKKINNQKTKIVKLYNIFINNFKDEIDDNFEFFNKTQWVKKLDKAKKSKEKYDNLKIINGEYIQNNRKLFFKLSSLKELLEEKIKEDTNLPKHMRPRVIKNLYYFRSSFKGSDYTIDLGKDNTTINSRFIGENFQEYSLETGITKQINGYHFFGLNLRYNYTSNLDNLSSKKYSLEEIDSTLTQGEFTTTQEVNALVGEFEKFNRYDINFDYIYLLDLKAKSNAEGESNFLLSINPYFRHHIIEDKKNNTTIGLGFHSFSVSKNRLLGGIFIEANDVFKVASEVSLGRRINYGLVVKYSLKDIKL